MAKTFSVSVKIGGKLDSSLSGAVRKAEAQVAGLGRHLQAVNQRTTKIIGSIGSGITKAGKKLQDAGGKVTAGLSAPTGLLAFGAGKQAFEFEKAGNFLEALGDATAQQRKELEDYANVLNKKYPQTLTEIINTGNEMLKGGFNFDQMKGAIDQTLATAVLGEMSPAEVGNMMARTINSFQMPMATYQQAMDSSTKVSDRMTYAAVKTTASLRDMGEMFKYVGGAMSAGGNDIDTATAFAMAFAKNGTVASEAGVALRSAIVRMVKMPAKGQAALNRANIDLGKYVGGDQPITSDRVIAGLEAGGIDAAQVKGQIDKLLKDKGLAGSRAKLSAAITKAVQSHLGSDSAIDAQTIAENVQDSLVAAGSKIDVMGFFKELQAKLRAGVLSYGDISAILEGRHFSRYQAIFQSDLDGLLGSIQSESGGYTQSRYGTILKGIVGPVYELDAALEKLSVAFGRAAFPTLAEGIDWLANAIQRLADTSPRLLRFIAYTGLATIALGPFMLAAGAAMRVLGPLATGLLTLGRVASVGLAARLTATAAGVRAIAVAASIGAVGRLRAMGAGLIALTAVGGKRAALAAMAGGVAGMGRMLLTFPLAALRGIGSALMLIVANPVGLTITAIVAALTALGVWVSNNWQGIGTFFTALGESFMRNLGPGASAGVEKIASALGAAWDWLNRLLGPIDETGAKWRSWGETIGGVVAGAVNAVGDAISRVIGLFTAAIEKAQSLGAAVRSMATGGPGGAAGRAGAAIGAMVPPAPAIAGARAAGGPVWAGGTFLVGENGPELFTPNRSGSIVPNNRLGVLNRSGGATSAAASTKQENHFHISGAQDPGAVAREVEAVLRRMESRQRGLLSD